MTRLLTDQDIARWYSRLALGLASVDDRRPVMITDPWGDTTYEGYTPRKPFTPAKVV